MQPTRKGAKRPRPSGPTKPQAERDGERYDVRLPYGTGARIDAMRGDTPRSRVIARFVLDGLDAEEVFR